ncbi:heterokaryon incompatibility protein-domain-containing protein [Leptodontidium sp. MPI-SDFR-AT-0119]|nr:heterokaryon incompatibility protein-domain-containing protein [Leptodontidium sp. MPI-SDFR-AT-0119]
MPLALLQGLSRWNRRLVEILTRLNPKHLFRRRRIWAASNPWRRFSTPAIPSPDRLYEQLDPNRREIRLISLSPGKLFDPIVVALAPFSLDDEDTPAYEALSYVWGDTSDRQNIELNGVTFPVTANLYMALQFLRIPSGIRILWVDAICINQDDVEERNNQVGLMSSIYSSAWRVLCWLGDSKDDGVVHAAGYGISMDDALRRAWEESDLSEPGILDAALQYSNHGAENKELQSRLHGSDISTVQDTLAALAFIRILGDPDGDQESTHPCELAFFENQPSRSNNGYRIASRFEGAFKALSRIVDSPWWDRVWTVQEPCLAKDLWMVHYHLVMPFSVVEEAIYWLNFHALQCCEYDLSTLPGEENRIFKRFIEKVNEIRTLRSWGDYHPRDLMDLLQRFRPRQAKDPRDKVNALLGLSAWEGSDPLRPSYSFTIEQTYINATLALIRLHNNLNDLEGHGSTTNHPKLPSWVQDWSVANVDGNGFSQIESGIGVYNAGGQLTKAVPCCDSILVVDGVEVDTISSVGIVCDTSMNSTQKIFALLKEWEAMVASGAGLEGAYANGKTRSDAFRSTLSADMVRQTRTISRGLGARPREYYRSGDSSGGRRYAREENESDEELSRNWWGVVQASREEEAELKENWIRHLTTVVMNVVEHNRFFLTERGLMGIGGSGVCVGDKVFVLRGGNLPFILRSVQDQRQGREGCHHLNSQCFHLIGTSYVHGIMDGESLKDGTRKKGEVHLC